MNGGLSGRDRANPSCGPGHRSTPVEFTAKDVEGVVARLDFEPVAEIGKPSSSPLQRGAGVVVLTACVQSRGQGVGARRRLTATAGLMKGGQGIAQAGSGLSRTAEIVEHEAQVVVACGQVELAGGCLEPGASGQERFDAKIESAEAIEDHASVVGDHRHLDVEPRGPEAFHRPAEVIEGFLGTSESSKDLGQVGCTGGQRGWGAGIGTSSTGGLKAVDGIIGSTQVVQGQAEKPIARCHLAHQAPGPQRRARLLQHLQSLARSTSRAQGRPESEERPTLVWPPMPGCGLECCQSWSRSAATFHPPMLAHDRVDVPHCGGSPRGAATVPRPNRRHGKRHCR